MRAGGAQQINQILGIAQGGKIRCRDDGDLVGADQCPPCPAGPDMGHIQHNRRDAGAQQVKKLVQRILGEIQRAVEHRGSREEGQVLAAAGQEPVEQVRVEAIGREDRIRDALGRILIEIEPGRAKGNIKIGNDGR